MTVPADDARAAAERLVGGRTSSGWRIGELLRVNGVGALYRASRGSGDGTERAVLHVASAEVERSGPMRAELQRGAWASGRLEHARVCVPIDESTTTEGVPTIAWPMPSGRPLAECIDAGGGLPREDALRILEHVLDVLETAHATAMIHGAIDPWAVWQTPRRSARVILFAFPPGVRDPALYDPRGLVALRRDAYQAPELAEEFEPATESSDLYALAMVVAGAMVGPLPARLGRTLAREKLSILGVDDALASVLAYGLGRSPAERYPSAPAMLQDVRRVFAGEKPMLEDSGDDSGSHASVFGHESTSSVVLDLRMRERAAIRARSLRDGKPVSLSAPSQARGNAILVLMMAAILGAATWAVYNERQEDERTQRPSP